MTNQANRSVNGRYAARRAARGGFTLLEVVLVILLIGMIVAFAWPDFLTSNERARLAESNRRLRSLIAWCRAEAQNEARAYRIVFRPDGSIEVRRQLDPIDAPHIYRPVTEPWAQTAVLLEGVWVESLLPLPEGPAPVTLENEMEVYDEELEEELPIPVEDLDQPFELDFAADGASGSMILVLRDKFGYGMEITFDGRVQRYQVEELPPLEEGAIERPESYERPEDPYSGMTDAEILEQFQGQRNR